MDLPKELSGANQVTCRRHWTKAKGKHWIYELTFFDGRKPERLRVSSRKYDLAHIYPLPVVGNGKGLKRYFGFGKKPDRWFLRSCNNESKTVLINHI